MTSGSLFDLSPAPTAFAPRPADWVPDTPPELHGETEIRLDAETTGLRWWDGDRPVGWAYHLPASGRRGYLAVRHHGGGNGVSEDALRRWMHDLAGCRITNINTKFDAHMAIADGYDWRAIGCRLSDVAHHAALLNDHRFRFNLEQLAKDFLGEDEGKYVLPFTKDQICKAPAWQIAPYAIQDVVLVSRLEDAMRPEIREQDLERVLQIEQDIIPVVVEMETNGCNLDMELLDQWCTDARAEYESCLFDLYRASGVQVSSPDSRKDLTRLFDALHIPIIRTAQGNASFTGDILKSTAKKYPIIEKLLYAAQLADLLSKYLDKYRRTVRESDGWIRFNLHQLRTGKDEDDKKGTVSGRFSAAGDDDGGFNPQQVVSAKKQEEKHWCEKFPIRRLFKPAAGLDWVSVDADQIEYRIFGHYANDPAMLSRYAATPPYETIDIDGHEYKISGPDTDYHAIVQIMLRRLVPDIGRKDTKITNFCKLFGAQYIKFAWTLGTIDDQQFELLTEEFSNYRDPHRYEKMRQHPLLKSAAEIYDAYDEAFPAGRKMLKEAADLAKTRGWVKTYSGRRSRFPHGNRKHKALNNVIQGTAADANKLMLIDLYRDRKFLEVEVLRLTMHDEVNFDAPKTANHARLQEFFNTQRIPLRIPITWGMGVGPSWGQAKGKA